MKVDLNVNSKRKKTRERGALSLSLPISHIHAHTYTPLRIFTHIYTLTHIHIRALYSLLSALFVPVWCCFCFRLFPFSFLFVFVFFAAFLLLWPLNPDLWFWSWCAGVLVFMPYIIVFWYPATWILDLESCRYKPSNPYPRLLPPSPTHRHRHTLRSTPLVLFLVV